MEDHWGQTFGSPGPPLKNRGSTSGNSDIRCDSVIARPGIVNGQANSQSHLEVVTFAPEQAYPEYILRFVEV